MSNWLKSWLGPLLLILVAVLCGIWWMFIFNERKLVKVTVTRKNLPDTTYIVVPSYTKYFLHKNGKDTTYLFYDRNKNVVLKYSTNDK